MKHFLLRCSCSPSPEKLHEEVCPAKLGYIKDSVTEIQPSRPNQGYTLFIFFWRHFNWLGDFTLVSVVNWSQITQEYNPPQRIPNHSHPLLYLGITQPKSSGWAALTDFFFFFFFERDRERQTEHKWGRGRQRGRHRIRSKLGALNCQHRAWHKAWTHRQWDPDLSQSQTLNRLSHPGTPPRG